MPSNFGLAVFQARRLAAPAKRLLCAFALVFGPVVASPAEERPAAAVLLDRLCAETLRANEEDRLFGLISITVRATIKYQGGEFSPDLIDDAVQDSLIALIEACPRIIATDDARRLGMAVGIARDATLNRLQEAKPGYSGKQIDKATAADLSQELAAEEIDAWLDGLPPRQRVLALLLYASDLGRIEIARAAGLPPAALDAAFRDVKADLLKFFRAESSGPLPPPIPLGPAIAYREAGTGFAELLKPAPAPIPAATGATSPGPTARITGISGELYAGWSLLATVAGLPPDRTLEIAEPIVIESDGPARRRMIVVAADEVSDPHDMPRRFVLKAFAIDGDLAGPGLRDTFHLAAPTVDNAEARQTLRMPSLASMEIARCLWRDYGTAPDPGLCR